MDDLEAGDFSSWLSSMQRALGGEGDAEVPCDGCTACCRSSQFVHVGPDEADTLAHIPVELLFPAPHRPSGHLVLGYDERGHCPMLVENRCSIYAHRPRACRTYDCRVFPAAGLEPDEQDLVEIGERARRWRFAHPTARDREQHDAVRAMAEALRRHPERLPDGVTWPTVTQIAVLAIGAVSERP
jgi:Fe-S-cluster containining protein